MTVVTLNGERRELGERATVEAAVLAAAKDAVIFRPSMRKIFPSASVITLCSRTQAPRRA